jgi:hypothetical protein
MDEMRAAGVPPNSATWTCLLAAEANAGAVLMCSIHKQETVRPWSASFMACFAQSHAPCLHAMKGHIDAANPMQVMHDSP